MNRKKEIYYDIWDIMCKVYTINANSNPSEKQEEFLQKVIEYIDANLSTRRKKVDTKEKQ